MQYNQFDGPQAVADALKRLADQHSPTPALRRENKAVYDLIQRFEGTRYDAVRFGAAVENAEAIAGEMEFKGRRHPRLTFSCRPMYTNGANAVLYTLQEYFRLIDEAVS